MKARAERRAPLQPDIVEEVDVEQRSAEWFALRLGVPTASVFGTIMADGRDGGPSKTRADLLHRMAAEIIYKRPLDTYQNADMAHGIEIEPDALDHYAFTRGVEVRRVGFVRRTILDPLLGDFIVGCSPDGMVGLEGVVQVKRMKPQLIVKLIDGARFPAEHKWQCHGEIWVTGRQWADLKIYYAERTEAGFFEFPISPTFRIQRDEAMIAELRKGVETFSYELRKLVADVRKKGGVR
jgi:hypothetical protein